MGRKPVKNKKEPSDYPQMAFRLSRKDKETINSRLDKLQEKFNSSRKDGEPYTNKNELIIRALDIGIKKLEKAV